MITTIMKCSEDERDITSELTGQISRNSNILSVCRWANKKVGAIFPLDNDYKLCFSEVIERSKFDLNFDFMPTNESLANDSESFSHIISCGGIVAHWLIDSCGLHPTGNGLEILNDTNFRKNILHNIKEKPQLKALYEKHIEAYITKSQELYEAQINEKMSQPGFWKEENNYKFEVKLEDHLKDEQRMFFYDERHLYPFFRSEDIEFMRDIAHDYQEYIQYKLTTSSLDTSTQSPSVDNRKKEKKKKDFTPTTNTFEIENTTKDRLKLIFNLCIKVEWLDSSTRVDDWLKLFDGVASDITMVWKYEDRPALRDLFKMMAYDKYDGQKSFISPRRNYLTIVSSHFVAEHQTQSKTKTKKYITDFKCRHRKNDEQKIELCRRILAWPQNEEIDLDTLLYQMQEDYNKKMIDEAQPDVAFDENNAALQAGQRTRRKSIR